MGEDAGAVQVKKMRLSKSDEQVEKEFPTFLNQLKWTLITDKIVQDNSIQVNPDEIRNFAKQQLFGYMGGYGRQSRGSALGK